MHRCGCNAGGHLRKSWDLCGGQGGCLCSDSFFGLFGRCGRGLIVGFLLGRRGGLVGGFLLGDALGLRGAERLVVAELPGGGLQGSGCGSDGFSGGGQCSSL